MHTHTDLLKHFDDVQDLQRDLSGVGNRVAISVQPPQVSSSSCTSSGSVASSSSSADNSSYVPHPDSGRVMSDLSNLVDSQQFVDYLKQKKLHSWVWDETKKTATVDEIFARFKRAFEPLIDNGKNLKKPMLPQLNADFVLCCMLRPKLGQVFQPRNDLEFFLLDFLEDLNQFRRKRYESKPFTEKDVPELRTFLKSKKEEYSKIKKPRETGSASKANSSSDVLPSLSLLVVGFSTAEEVAGCNNEAEGKTDDQVRKGADTSQISSFLAQRFGASFFSTSIVGPSCGQSDSQPAPKFESMVTKS